MSTNYYLVNEDRKIVFCLGTGIGRDIDLLGIYQSGKSKLYMITELARSIEAGNWAQSIKDNALLFAKGLIENIESMMGGFYGCICIPDSDDRLWDETFGRFLLVGSVYENERQYFGLPVSKKFWSNTDNVMKIGSPVRTPRGIGEVTSIDAFDAVWVKHTDGIGQWFAKHNVKLLVEYKGKITCEKT